MKRRIAFAGALAAAVTLTSTFAVAAAPAAAAALDRWKPGTNYQLLAKPQTPAVKRGKVEVAEVFWYGCSHCYALDPALESWKVNKPAFIEFVRIPVIWGPTHVQHARLYYTMLQLGRPELHAKIFDTIHLRGNMLAAETDEEARALHLLFFRDYGITEKKFNAAYDSAAVKANVQRAQELTALYEAASVPLIIVQGKYVTSVSMAGNERALLDIVTDLATSEKGR